MSRVPGKCPLCGADAAAARTFVAETIEQSRLTSLSYASRKEPEFMSHRLLRCPDCDLVYADMPPGERMLEAAYHDAGYDSATEADDAARAYIDAIRPVLARLSTRGSALEIGTGTGVFLEHLSHEGFADVRGVEPSAAAIAAAPAHRRAWIRQAMFDPSDYQPASLDLICCFMTLEHVHDPAALARDALGLLRPGGVFVTVTHDYRSLVNRVLGRRSPIIDIEHLQVFSAPSVRALFERAGFRDVRVAGFANRYALRYWMRLSPLPHGLKRAAQSALAAVGLSEQRMSVNVGNRICSGFRPAL